MQRTGDGGPGPPPGPPPGRPWKSVLQPGQSFRLTTADRDASGRMAFACLGAVAMRPGVPCPEWLSCASVGSAGPGYSDHIIAVSAR